MKKTKIENQEYNIIDITKILILMIFITFILLVLLKFNKNNNIEENLIKTNSCKELGFDSYLNQNHLHYCLLNNTAVQVVNIIIPSFWAMHQKYDFIIVKDMS